MKQEIIDQIETVAEILATQFMDGKIAMMYGSGADAYIIMDGKRLNEIDHQGFTLLLIGEWIAIIESRREHNPLRYAWAAGAQYHPGKNKRGELLYPFN